MKDQRVSSISATYESTDGKVYKSRLLTSGWWGYARHMNYTGDLLGVSYTIIIVNHFYIFFYPRDLQYYSKGIKIKTHVKCFPQLTYGDTGNRIFAVKFKNS